MTKGGEWATLLYKYKGGQTKLRKHSVFLNTLQIIHLWSKEGMFENKWDILGIVNIRGEHQKLWSVDVDKLKTYNSSDILGRPVQWDAIF